MRRGRHRLKSRARQNRALVARLDRMPPEEISVRLEFFTSSFTVALKEIWAGIETFASRFLDAMVGPAENFRRQREGDFSAYYGEPGSGYRVYPDGLWETDAWSYAPNVIDVEGRVVDQPAAPSAVEVWRGDER